MIDFRKTVETGVDPRLLAHPIHSFGSVGLLDVKKFEA